jgi:Flp pilus assembly pilin Flp
MNDWLRRWYADDSGQDLIEYALLATLVGIVGVLAFQAMGSNMNTIYGGWDTAVQGKWEPQSPIPTP